MNEEDLRGQIESTKQYVLNQTKVDSKPSGNDVRYTQVTSGLGILDGVDTDLYSYKAPDGEIIVTVKATIGSAGGVAAKAFHQKIDHSAAEIVKQEDILDESGKVIGYRSILTLVDKDGKKSTSNRTLKPANTHIRSATPSTTESPVGAPWLPWQCSCAAVSPGAYHQDLSSVFG